MLVILGVVGSVIAGPPSVVAIPEDEDALFRLTTELATQHKPWGVPLAGGAMRALFVANRGSHRDTIELVQRLELDFDAVLCGDNRAVNTLGSWMYNWGWRGTTDGDVSGELRQKLRKRWNVIVLAPYPFWENYPDDIRSIIWEKIRTGSGLVQFGARKSFLDELAKQNPELLDERSVGYLLRAFDQWCVNKRFSPVDCYRLGKGRVVAVRCPAYYRYYLPAPPGARASVRSNIHSRMQGGG